MFTGIITDIGTITRAERRGDLRLTIATGYDADTIFIGESIAVNGACLTVVDKGTQMQQHWFSVDVSAETLRCTAPRWNEGMQVNLERALRMGDSLSGHMISGHVDGLATLLSVQTVGDSLMLTIDAPKELSRFIAAKGSVTLDGVSLTVNNVEDARFTVNIIPHTHTHTTLGERKAGDALNLEIDMIARYVERLVCHPEHSEGSLQRRDSSLRSE